MKRFALLVLAILAFAGCSGEEPKPLSEPGEKLYTVRGVILSREATSNTLNIEHEAIPNFMAAMTMDFQVRGAKVAQLPPDGSRIEATLHHGANTFWLTDVKQIP